MAKHIKDRVAMECYEKRKRNLSSLGYSSYKEYLASEDWAKIRAFCLKERRRCLLCMKPATQVHHLDYREGTLLGLWPERLVSLCDLCHEEIEFEDGKKLTVGQAKEKLFTLARRRDGVGYERRARWYREVMRLTAKRDFLHANFRRRESNQRFD